MSNTSTGCKYNSIFNQSASKICTIESNSLFIFIDLLSFVSFHLKLFVVVYLGLFDSKRFCNQKLKKKCRIEQRLMMLIETTMSRLYLSASCSEMFSCWIVYLTLHSVDLVNFELFVKWIKSPTKIVISHAIVSK